MRIPDQTQNIQIGVQMTFPSGGNREGRTVNFRFEDRNSNMEVLTFEMSAEQFTSMISGLYLGDVDATIIGEELFCRVGKRAENMKVDAPEELTKGAYGSPSQAMDEFTEKWLAENPEWELASWYRHNFGWVLTARRWVAVEPENVPK